jgi:2-amino-4-hydroxy-6-hydroxymethyldihydropteridine diphosphokinase
LPPAGTWAFVALGSNLGHSQQILREAIERLSTLSDAPPMKSSLWRSAPVDCPPGSPDFINAVIGLRTRAGETPESLLAKLQAIEREFGRGPKKLQNEPRPLDLDLIAFGNQTRSSSELFLPHPRATNRRFVLEPMCEVVPSLVLPGETRTAAQLLAALPADASVRRVE